MIIETIKIGDKEVKFACSAGTLKRYRDAFNEDLFAQIQKLTSDNPEVEVLTKLAYVMAKQAGDTLEYEDWLDQFDFIDFIGAIPKISEIWAKNNIQTSSSKKK